MGWRMDVNNFKSVMFSAEVLILWHAQHHGKLCDSTECWASLDLGLSCPEAKLRICILDAAVCVIQNHCSEHTRNPDLF